MHRFKNILLIFNPKVANEAALTRAVSLAETNESQLTVVRVVEKGPHGSSVTSDAMPPMDVQELVIQVGQEELQKFLTPVRQAGIEVRGEVLSGTPFLEITRAVMREKHDLVIITAQSDGGLKTRLFGSTSLHLMRKCPCPVWAFKPTENDRFSRIMAAVDTDPDDMNEEKDALNITILDLATSLAQDQHAELHVVHAWTMFAEQALRSPRAKVSECQVDEWVQRNEKQHKRQLDVLLGKYALESVDLKVHLVKGKAESLILGIAMEKQVDLLVMGTVCHTGIAGYFIGNTAERILRHVDCSVLTVKPAGFVSPITSGTQ